MTENQKLLIKRCISWAEIKAGTYNMYDTMIDRLADQVVHDGAPIECSDLAVPVISAALQRRASLKRPASKEEHDLRVAVRELITSNQGKTQ